MKGQAHQHPVPRGTESLHQTPKEGIKGPLWKLHMPKIDYGSCNCQVMFKSESDFVMTAYRMDKQQGPAVEQRELYSISYDKP